MEAADGGAIMGDYADGGSHEGLAHLTALRLIWVNMEKQIKVNIWAYLIPDSLTWHYSTNRRGSRCSSP